MLLQLQTLNVGYAQNAKDSVLLPPTGKQIHLYNAEATNNSGGAIDVGLFKRINPDDYDFYTVTDASDPKAEISNGIKSGTATSLFTATDNDGFLIQCKSRFNLLVFNITSHAAGGTFAIKYYNGSSYAALTEYVVPTEIDADGYIQIVVPAPHDWVIGTTAAVGGSSLMYSLMMIATDAPAGAIKASAIEIGQTLKFISSLAANGLVNINFYANQPLILGGKEGIIPYFGGSASVKNCVSATYIIQE